jgi:hypothetical protein
MKIADVKIGQLYLVKVSGSIQPVRITAEANERLTSAGYRHGGWHAVNINTGREVRIRSVQRLRSPVS